jgi:hypothetical protein
MVDDMLPTWSWVDQAVAVPSDAVTVTLEADLRAVSEETTGGDWQMMALRDAAGRPLRLAYWQPGVSGAGWQHVSLALEAGTVAGATVRPTFEVYNDGDGAPTALYADNVRLVACRADGVSVHEPVPPGADVRIEYPIRAFPGQENFLQPTCDELAFESLIVHNHGVVPVAMAGWTLRDLEGHRYTFPAVTLGEDERVRLWTQPGADTTDGRWTDVYWDRTEPVWNNAGPTGPWDVAVLADDAGTEVARRGYP